MPAALPSVAILAGGLATRLRPITEKIPKALVPVAGRPFLAHQLELLSQQGFTHVVLCVGHLAEQIENAFGNHPLKNLQLEYSHDGEQLAGTAGALRRALPKLGDSFLVLYGDSYLKIDFRPICAAFTQCGYPMLMTVMENSHGKEPSNVHFQEGKVLEYHKKNPHTQMHHIDYGLNLCRAEVFRELCPDQADLSEVQSNLAKRGLLAGYEVNQPYYEIGSPSGLQTLENLLSKKQNS